MYIKFMDGSEHHAKRAEITNGRLEIDFTDKPPEELQELFSVPANLAVIDLLTDSHEKYGELSEWSVYGGVMLVGDTRTVILTKAVDVTEQRLTAAEADALKAKSIAEDLKANGIPFEQNEVLNASVMVARVNAQVLSDVDALKVKAIYPAWEELVAKGFTAAEAGYKFTHRNQLYKTIHENQSFRVEWIPGDGTESLFIRMDESHAGTLEDPIPAAAGMEYVKGLYYLEDGQAYRMIREGMEDGESVVLQFLPSALAGQYFELVK